MADMVRNLQTSQWDKIPLSFKAAVVAMENDRHNPRVAGLGSDVRLFMESVQEVDAHALSSLLSLVSERDYTNVELWLAEVGGRKTVTRSAPIILPTPGSSPVTAPPAARVLQRASVEAGTPKAPVTAPPVVRVLQRASVEAGTPKAPAPGAKPASNTGSSPPTEAKPQIGADPRVSRMTAGVRRVLSTASQRVIAFVLSTVATAQNWWGALWMQGNPLDDGYMRLGVVLTVVLLFAHIMVPGRVRFSSLVKGGVPALGVAYVGLKHGDSSAGNLLKSDWAWKKISPEPGQELEDVKTMSDDLVSADLRIARGVWTDEDTAMLKRHEQAITDLVRKYGSLVAELGQKPHGRVDAVKLRPLRIGSVLSRVGRRRLPLPAMTDGRIAALNARVETLETGTGELAAHKARMENMKREIHDLRAALDRVTKLIENDPYKQALKSVVQRNNELNALNGLLLVVVGSVVTAGVICVAVPGTYAALTNALGFTWLGAYLENLVPVALYGWLQWGVSTSVSARE